MSESPQWQRQLQLFLQDSREVCWKKSIVSSVAGAGMGIGIGVFLGTFEGAHGELIGKTMSEQLYNGFRTSFVAGYRRSLYFSKEFAVIGALYAGIECVIARERASDDMYTALIAGTTSGMIAGAIRSRTLGTPSAMLKHTLKSAAGFGIAAVVFEKAYEHFSSH